MGLFVRTIGIVRAKAKIGMAKLAYNLTRFVWHEADVRRPDGKVRQSPARMAEPAENGGPTSKTAAGRFTPPAMASDNHPVDPVLRGVQLDRRKILSFLRKPTPEYARVSLPLLPLDHSEPR